MRHFQPTAGIVLRFTRGRCRALPFALASFSCWIRNGSHIATHVVLLLVEGNILQKSLRLRRFKADLDEIWQEFSSRKYASIDGVELSS